MHSLFLVIEGLDGSGGTTQCRLLVDWLKQQGVGNIIQTREPTDGPVGRFIRRALAADQPESVIGDSVLPYLFAADRQDHLTRLIAPTLAQGGIVVSDRYYHSSLAYQSLSVGLDTVSSLNAGFRAPDLTIFLDLSPELCLDRILARGADLERFETLPRLTAIAAAYERVLTRCETRGEAVVRIDASLSRPEIHTRIIGALRARFPPGAPSPAS